MPDFLCFFSFYNVTGAQTIMGAVDKLVPINDILIIILCSRPMTKKDATKHTSKDSNRSTSAMCEQVAHTTLDLFVDYLQRAPKNNAAMTLDAQKLTFQSRQFKKDEQRTLLEPHPENCRTMVG